MGIKILDYSVRKAAPRAARVLVMGALERGGKVRAGVIPDRTKVSMQPIIRGSVAPSTAIYSDEHGYN